MEAVYYPPEQEVMETTSIASSHRSFAPGRRSPARFEIRVSHLEMENLRRIFHFKTSDETVQWICHQYNIDYHDVDTIQVVPDSGYMEASIILTIHGRCQSKYNQLGIAGAQALRKFTSDEPVSKKDMLMVRKKRSITLS
jgi:hypothetical protein